MKASFKKVVANESGQGLTEYAILMVLIVIGCVTIAGSIGTQLKIKLTGVRDRIQNKMTLPED